MANVYIIESGCKTTIDFLVNGEDIIDGMLEAYGDYVDILEDGCETYYTLHEDTAEWYRRWAEVEGKIVEAWENASEDLRDEHVRLVQAYGHDLEALHDAACELFGITL